MSNPLATLYTGPLGHLCPPAFGEEPPDDVLLGVKLLDPACLKRLVAQSAEAHPDPDWRALVSLWSKWHFSTVILHGLAANLLLNRGLPIGLDRVALRLSPKGHTQSLWLRDTGRPLSNRSPFSRFSHLIEDHLALLIPCLADLSGVAPRVFWSNAGNYFEYTVRLLETHPMAHQEGIQAGLELMSSRRLQDGRRNPLFQPVQYLAGAEVGQCRVRRICCLQYRMASLGVCANCPLATSQRTAVSPEPSPGASSCSN